MKNSANLHWKVVFFSFFNEIRSKCCQWARDYSFRTCNSMQRTGMQLWVQNENSLRYKKKQDLYLIIELFCLIFILWSRNSFKSSFGFSFCLNNEIEILTSLNLHNMVIIYNTKHLNRFIFLLTFIVHLMCEFNFSNCSVFFDMIILDHLSFLSSFFFLANNWICSFKKSYFGIIKKNHVLWPFSFIKINDDPLCSLVINLFCHRFYLFSM